MRTCFSARGLSALPLVLVLVSAFACTGSPTQPDSVIDPPAGSARQFDAPSTFAQPSRLAEEELGDAELIEQEDASELVDAEGVEEIDAGDFAANTLTATGPTAAATAGTVAVTGVIKDKTTGRAVSRASVKVTGLAPVTSNSKGAYRINVRPGTRTFKFSKKGYATKSVTKRVSRAMKIDVLLVATLPALSSVTLSDNSVPVGTVVTGTVKLNKAAPSGGAKVLLSSTSTAIATVMSSSVTIAAGKTTGTFKVDANAAGSTVIKGKYNNASKTDQLTVTGGGGGGGGVDGIVAKFTYRPSQCEVIANPGGNPTLLATCTFDASETNAPAGSTYRWAFPGDVFTETSPILRNFGLSCGSLPNGIFERRVSLTVRTPSGASDTSHADVTFTKSGLC